MPASRIGRWLRLALIAVGLAVVAWAVGTWVAESLDSRQRAERIVAFAAQADQQAADLRALVTRPLHDLRAVRQSARDQLDGIAVELGVGVPPVRDAPAVASYRIGQLTLALGDADAALRHLDNAWRAGLRDPGLAVERARAHDLAFRDRARLRLDTDSLAEVAESLRAIPEDIPFDAEQRAGIDRLLDLHEDGVLSAEGPIEGPIDEPHEALFRADAALIAARAAPEPTWDRVAEHYRRAIEAAPSEPRAYAGLCSTWTEVVVASLNAAGEAPIPASLGDRAETACSDGLIADPTDPSLLIAMARLQRYAAEADRRRERDPSASVAAAEEAVRRAVGDGRSELDPAWTVAALRWLGEARLVRARWLDERGEDPSADLDAAEASLQQARALREH